MSTQGEEIFLDMFEDEYRSMTVSCPSFDVTFVFFLLEKLNMMYLNLQIYFWCC